MPRERMRPVYAKGEREAQERLAMSQVEVRGDGGNGGVIRSWPYREIVRLGFMLEDVADGKERAGGDIEEDLIWFSLENTSAKPDVQFMVDGVNVREILLSVCAAPVALWHCHVSKSEPSELDIEQFPRWLVDIGVVFCIEQNTNVHYDHHGVIAPLDMASGNPLASKAE